MGIDYSEAKGIIKNGDLFVCRGQWFFSRLIRFCTRENVSHVGFAVWMRFGTETEDRLCIFESMEGYGVRLLPVSHVLEEYDRSGGVMFWQPLIDESINRNELLGFALNHWTDKYPPLYQFLVGASPVLRDLRLWRGASLDVSPDRRHCSELIADSFKFVGYKDAKISALTTPGDITRYKCLGGLERVTYRTEMGDTHVKARGYRTTKTRFHDLLRHKIKNS